MREHSINSLDNFICGWYIDPKICDELIDYHKTSETYAGVVCKKDTGLVVDVEIKDSIDCLLRDDTLGKKYFEQLQLCVDDYVLKYPHCNKGSPWRCLQPPAIQYYPPNAGYHSWHTERQFLAMPAISRHLVFMTYLNDETDAGETEFFHQKIKVKPEKGLTLIWGCDWTFFHRGITSPSQDKYVITGWWNYID